MGKVLDGGVLICRVAAKEYDDGMDWADVAAAVMGSIKCHRHAHVLTTKRPSTPPVHYHHHIHRLTTRKIGSRVIIIFIEAKSQAAGAWF